MATLIHFLTNETEPPLPMASFVSYSTSVSPQPFTVDYKFFANLSIPTQHTIIIESGNIERYTWLGLKENKPVFSVFRVENIYYS